MPQSYTGRLKVFNHMHERCCRKSKPIFPNTNLLLWTCNSVLEARYSLFLISAPSFLFSIRHEHLYQCVESISRHQGDFWIKSFWILYSSEIGAAFLPLSLLAKLPISGFSPVAFGFHCPWLDWKAGTLQCWYLTWLQHLHHFHDWRVSHSIMNHVFNIIDLSYHRTSMFFFSFQY